MTADRSSVDLAPPNDSEVGRAIAKFAAAVRSTYGSRVKGIYLFGSRARGEHTGESDADIAVVLADGEWNAWTERMRLADMEYDIIVETGAEPQAWPVRYSEWLDPAKHANPALIRAMRRDAQEIGGAP